MSQVQEASESWSDTVRLGLYSRSHESTRRSDRSATVDSLWLRLDVSPPTLLDSWPPRAEAVVFDSSRGSTRVSRPVAQTESDSSDIHRCFFRGRTLPCRQVSPLRT